MGPSIRRLVLGRVSSLFCGGELEVCRSGSLSRTGTGGREGGDMDSSVDALKDDNMALAGIALAVVAVVVGSAFLFVKLKKKGKKRMKIWTLGLDSNAFDSFGVMPLKRAQGRWK